MCARRLPDLHSIQTPHWMEIGMRSCDAAVLGVILLALAACGSNASDVGLGGEQRGIDQDISATHGGSASLDSFLPAMSGPWGSNSLR